MSRKTTQELIACADREIRFRQRVYPRRVADGRMTQAKADHEIACMEQIRDTLAEKEQGERLI